MIVPKIVSISGWKEVGKDTFADRLVETYGYNKIAFADPLKKRCADWIRFPDSVPDDVPDNIRNLLERCSDEVGNKLIGDYVREKPYSVNLRHLLQFVGTEYFRGKDRCYWVKSMVLDPNLMYVITDRRFFEEDKLSLAYGAALWRINRYGHVNTDLHASEAQIPFLTNHITIENTFGRQDKIPALCKKYLELTAQFEGVVGVNV